MATTTAAPPAGAAPLRRLHLARAGFALVWAVLLFLTASSTVAAAVLLVLYPLVDVAAAVVDARSREAGAPVAGLAATVVVSALAAVGLAVALTSGVPAVLRVWGVWAVVAGAVQLVVAVRRRGVGGRWAMIASGSISVLAGVSFVLLAARPDASLAGVAGYALLGGVFFLVSGLRLGRAVGRG
ncbi:hypothetical protein ACQPX6_22615 [Actinomycetospora sp. CA-101289]|uniref:hypothetical protein n=1 Tax=Actinomycetospora sp. CA-101289 TaxID=3239893 RepID=UPI003D989B44